MQFCSSYVQKSSLNIYSNCSVTKCYVERTSHSFFEVPKAVSSTTRNPTPYLPPYVPE